MRFPQRSCGSTSRGSSCLRLGRKRRWGSSRCGQQGKENLACSVLFAMPFENAIICQDRLRTVRIEKSRKLCNVSPLCLRLCRRRQVLPGRRGCSPCSARPATALSSPRRLHPRTIQGQFRQRSRRQVRKTLFSAPFLI